MSSKYPEPPKLTSAKALMKQKVEPKPQVEESVQETDSAESELGSLFSAVPVIPQKDEPAAENIPTVEVAKYAGTSTEETSLKDVAKEDTDSITKETANSEISETDEALGQVENDSKETTEDTYGGPWGIIKYTGYISVAVWGVLVAVVTGASAYFFTPGDYTWITLSVLGFMTGVIAAVDRKTHLIKNQHTILTAILTVPLSVFVAFNIGAWNVLFGLLAALVVFGVFIFLIIKVGFGSGGDIKFSPVPAFALGVVNPLISALWLFYALIITVVLLVVRKQKATSFGEGMAISLPLAIASVAALYSLAGLPYMEPVTAL